MAGGRWGWSEGRTVNGCDVMASLVTSDAGVGEVAPSVEQVSSAVDASL